MAKWLFLLLSAAGAIDSSHESRGKFLGRSEKFEDYNADKVTPCDCEHLGDNRIEKRTVRCILVWPTTGKPASLQQEEANPSEVKCRAVYIDEKERYRGMLVTPTHEEPYVTVLDASRFGFPELKTSVMYMGPGLPLLQLECRGCAALNGFSNLRNLRVVSVFRKNGTKSMREFHMDGEFDVEKAVALDEMQKKQFGALKDDPKFGSPRITDRDMSEAKVGPPAEEDNPVESLPVPAPQAEKKGRPKLNDLGGNEQKKTLPGSLPIPRMPGMPSERVPPSC